MLLERIGGVAHGDTDITVKSYKRCIEIAYLRRYTEFTTHQKKNAHTTNTNENIYFATMPKWLTQSSSSRGVEEEKGTLNHNHGFQLGKKPSVSLFTS